MSFIAYLEFPHPVAHDITCKHMFVLIPSVWGTKLSFVLAHLPDVGCSDGRSSV